MSFTCRRIKKLMAEYIDGSGKPFEQELNRHLKECRSCANAFDELKNLSGLFKELPKYDAPAGFHASVLRRLRASDEKEVHGRGRHIAVVFAKAVAIVLIAVIGVISGSSLAMNLLNEPAGMPGARGGYLSARASFIYSPAEPSDRDLFVSVED